MSDRVMSFDFSLYVRIVLSCSLLSRTIEKSVNPASCFPRKAILFFFSSSSMRFAFPSLPILIIAPVFRPSFAKDTAVFVPAPPVSKWSFLIAIFSPIG